MKQPPVPSQYLKIALDLANRITRGELQEGSRIYGRSLMASEYQVSPETIRPVSYTHLTLPTTSRV